jgi:hypothetical protein
MLMALLHGQVGLHLSPCLTQQSISEAPESLIPEIQQAAGAQQCGIDSAAGRLCQAAGTARVKETRERHAGEDRRLNGHGPQELMGTGGKCGRAEAKPMGCTSRERTES